MNRAHGIDRVRRGAIALSLLAAVGAAASGTGCAPRDAGPELPTAAALEGLYGGGVTVRLKGNVVDVQTVQSADQLRRGGATWARVGPYVYLFSPQTQKLFETYRGLGGVRVTTVDGRGDLVARAMLESGTLNSVTWKKAIAMAGRARLEGTQRPSYILALIEYGEDLVEHEYSPRYVREDR